MNTERPDNDDLTLSEDRRRELIKWGASCCWRLLPIFIEHRPFDERLTDALNDVDRFCEGELTIGEMRKLAFSCHASARGCDDPHAKAVARMCGQAIAIAHMAGHSRNISNYTNKALEGDRLTEELDWQRSHLPDYLREYVYGR